MINAIYKNGGQCICPCGSEEFYISYDFKLAVCRKCGKVFDKNEYRQDIIDAHGFTREVNN